MSVAKLFYWAWGSQIQLYIFSANIDVICQITLKYHKFLILVITLALVCRSNPELRPSMHQVAKQFSRSLATITCPLSVFHSTIDELKLR